MPIQSSHTSGGNITDKNMKKMIFDFFSEYIDIFQQKARERNFILGEFSFGRPTDYYFWIDSKSLHCIYSSQYAGAMPNILYNDATDTKKSTYDHEELARWLHAQMGLTEWNGITFDFALVKTDSESRKNDLERIAEEQLMRERKAIIRKHQPLFISVDALKKFLEAANEDDFTNILLVPLLRHIGFENVKAKGHRDKSLEFGQDIRRMKFQLPTGHWLYFSAQVKTGDINTKSSDEQQHINQVIRQTLIQLDWEMPDQDIGRNVKPDHVLLITSGFITEAAKQHIFRHKLTQERRLLILEKETLINLCIENGLPESVQNTIIEFNKN
jgi:hypothetical protein